MFCYDSYYSFHAEHIDQPLKNDKRTHTFWHIFLPALMGISDFECFCAFKKPLFAWTAVLKSSVYFSKTIFYGQEPNEENRKIRVFVFFKDFIGFFHHLRRAFFLFVFDHFQDFNFLCFLHSACSQRLYIHKKHFFHKKITRKNRKFPKS